MDKFWLEWNRIGQELLDYGEEIQYGSSLVEVKFQKGLPSVIIRSKSVKRKYPDNDSANRAVGKILADSGSANFDGARTFTIAYHQGSVTQVILDEYGNTLLK